MAHLAFLFCCLVWGSNFILMERTSHALGPVSIAIGRLIGGAALIWIVWRFRHRSFRLSDLSRSDWLRIVAISLVANSWPFVIQPFLLSRGFGHGFFGMMVALVPLATVVISVPMLGVWPTPRQLVGVLGGLVCMGVIMLDGSDRGMPPYLLALAVSVPIAYACGNTYMKRRLSHIPSVPLAALLLAVAGAAVVPLQFMPGLLSELHIAAPAEPRDWPLAIVALVWLGAVGTGATIMLFVRMILERGPLYAGMTTYVVPVVALCWAQVDDETITARQVMAMAGVLAMVALVQLGSTHPTPEHPEGEPELIEPVFCPTEHLDNSIVTPAMTGGSSSSTLPSVVSE